MIKQRRVYLQFQSSLQIWQNTIIQTTRYFCKRVDKTCLNYRKRCGYICGYVGQLIHDIGARIQSDTNIKKKFDFGRHRKTFSFKSLDGSLRFYHRLEDKFALFFSGQAAVNEEVQNYSSQRSDLDTIKATQGWTAALRLLFYHEQKLISWEGALICPSGHILTKLKTDASYLF